MKLKIQNSKFKTALAALVLLLGASVARATLVEIPVNSLFGGAIYGKSLTITAANSLLTDGANLYAGNFTTVPASTTNPIVSLVPNTYLLGVNGIVKPVRFAVPDSTNTLNLVDLIINGPLFYFGTNGPANLYPSNNISFTTNSDGSIGISATSDGSTVVSNLAAAFNISDVSVLAAGGWLNYSNFGGGIAAKTFKGDGSQLTGIDSSVNTNQISLINQSLAVITNGSPMLNLALNNLKRPYADGWIDQPIGYNNWYQDGGIGQFSYTNHIAHLIGLSGGIDFRAMLAPWGMQPYLQIDDSIFDGFDINGIPTLMAGAGWNHDFKWIVEQAHTNGLKLGIWLQAGGGHFNLGQANCNPVKFANYLITNHVDYVKIDGYPWYTNLNDVWSSKTYAGELDFIAALRGANYPLHVTGAVGNHGSVNGNNAPGNLTQDKSLWLLDSYRATSNTTNDQMGNLLGGDIIAGGWRPIVLNLWMDVALANPQILGSGCVPDFDPITSESWPNYLHTLELCTFFSGPMNFGYDTFNPISGFENVFSNFLSETSISIRRDLGTARKVFSTNGVDFIVKPNRADGVDLLLVNRNYAETISPIGYLGNSSYGPGYLMDLHTNYLAFGGTNFQYVFTRTNVTVSLAALNLNRPCTIYNAESDGRVVVSNSFSVTVPAGATKLFRLVPSVETVPSVRMLSNEKWFGYTNQTAYPSFPVRNVAQGNATWQLTGGGGIIYSNALNLAAGAMTVYGVNGATNFSAILGNPTVAPSSFTNLITVFIDGNVSATWLVPNLFATNVSLAIPAGSTFISFQTDNGASGLPCWMMNPALNGATGVSAASNTTQLTTGFAGSFYMTGYLTATTGGLSYHTPWAGTFENGTRGVCEQPLPDGTYTNLWFTHVYPAFNAGTNVFFNIYTNGVLAMQAILGGPATASTPNVCSNVTGSFKLVGGGTNRVVFGITNNSAGNINGDFFNWSIQKY